MQRFDNYRVYDWNEVSANFQHASLFLGNGFSISISSQFNYRSLFNRFLSHCTTREAFIFRTFGSTNFESIQEQLQLTVDTNSIFQIDSRPIRRISRKLREGLVQSVTDLHPSHTVLTPMRMGRICRDFDAFTDIFTTNYDNFLYHIILSTNERCQQRNVLRYQDFFRRRDNYLRFVKQTNQTYRNIYYLHGSLFLFKDPDSPLGTVKLEKMPNAELLDVTKTEINRGNIPIFVSEGSSPRKVKAINGNPYLQFCRQAFEVNRSNLVFYGFSFSRQDQHWLEILNRSTTGRSLAIALYIQGRAKEDVVQEIRDILSRLRFRSRNITLFNSGTLFQ